MGEFLKQCLVLIALMDYHESFYVCSLLVYHFSVDLSGFLSGSLVSSSSKIYRLYTYTFTFRYTNIQTQATEHAHVHTLYLCVSAYMCVCIFLFTHCLSLLPFLFSCPLSSPSPPFTLQKHDTLEEKKRKKKKNRDAITSKKKMANRELAQSLILAPQRLAAFLPLFLLRYIPPSSLP